ncbi:MAG: hypothetical protein HUJ27_10880 [Rhodobacteraceae bacterium]|nr:hypothetical protein [Paracoccaceae bacterium]
MKYLDSNPPRLSQSEDIACLDTLFGKTGTARDLYSDRDQNFLIGLEDESKTDQALTPKPDHSGGADQPEIWKRTLSGKLT